MELHVKEEVLVRVWLRHLHALWCTAAPASGPGDQRIARPVG